MPKALHSQASFPARLKKNGWTLVWGVGFLLTLALLIWRAPYGYCYNDEGAFLAIPYRLTMGDALLKHEWHLSQIGDILIYPFLQIYLAVTGGSTEGIFLHFRYLSVLLKALMGVYIYVRLKRLDPVAAVFASLCPMLALSVRGQSLSFDSNGCLLLLLCAVTIVTMKPCPRMTEWIFSGALFACAVLTCPLYVIVWPFLLLLCRIEDKRRSSGKAPLVGSMLSLKGGLFFTSGCALVALVFFGFLLSRASIKEIMEFLPMVLSDPDHLSIGFVEQTRLYITAFFAESEIGKVLCLLVALAFLNSLYMFTCRQNQLQRMRYRYLYIYLFLTAFGIYLFSYNWRYILMPIGLTGILLSMLITPPNSAAFCFLYCGGFLFGIFRHYTSNLRTDTISIYMCLPAIAVFLYLIQFVRENKATAFTVAKRVGLSLLVLTPLLTMGMLAYSVCNTAFEIRDGNMSALRVRLPNGPLAGLISTQAKHDHYMEVMEETKPIREAEKGPVLYFCDETWLWLSQKNEFATSSTWMIMMPVYNQIDYMDKLKAYYERFPEKRPRYLYIASEDNLSRQCFDPETFVDKFDLQNAKIDRLKHGYMIDASALLE